MNDVSVFIDHDVSIVSILDLKKESNDAIGCHALNEVAARLQEVRTRLVAVRFEKVIIKRRVRFSSELVTRLRVRNALDHTAL